MEVYKERADAIINNYIESNPQYSDMLHYLFEGGKRLRLMIVLAITDSLNKRDNKSICLDHLAIAIEIIHSASLIIDDLPFMDNDTMRRGRPTFHIKYGADTTIQFAMLLIRKALQSIFLSLSKLDNNVDKLYLFNRVINENLGRNGLPMGQIIDLNFLKNRIGLDTKTDYTELIYKKTTTLFNLSFLLPYIIFRGDELEDIKSLSNSFGLAFQLYDDFLDVEQDTQSKTPNYVIKYGIDNTKILFYSCIDRCNCILDTLYLNGDFFSNILGFLSKKVDDELKKNLVKLE